ncbi:unnamed protein product [Brassica oleracea]|uniref:Replication factor A C-terminal domain-containing protein n=2 Tax=Brassica oleracea var. oleracea TaxID=109376 RepID=A0A0D3AP30_BRAOL
MCTIAAIDEDMGWYYLSCKVCATKLLTVPNDCDDAVIPILDGGYRYYCTRCKTVAPKLLPRYNLHLVVLDNTSNIKLHLSDNLAFQLLHQPCVELTGKVTKEIEDPAYLPKALTNLFGKTFLFKILIEKNNYLYKHKTYKVVNLITNTDMINEFYVTYYPQGSQRMPCSPFSNLSRVIEGSITGIGSSSQSKQSTQLTPIRDLMREFDEMSDTKVTPILKIKKEENDFSG